MKDNGRDRSDRRHGARTVLVLAMLTALTSACQRETNPDTQDEETAPPSVSAEPSSGVSSESPVAVAPLTRADLLTAANAAADAVAGGRALPAANLKLKDRTFVLRLPFGCSAGQPDDWAGWTYDSKSEVLKLSARPERWRDEPWVRAVAGDLPFESVEGFWIERPWSSSEGCPSSAQGATALPAEPPATQPRQTLGLAQFFAQEAPRTSQRGARPYAFTLKAPALNPAEIRGFTLTISGRIVGFPDGQPVHCLNEDPALAPRCLIAAEFAEIAFEDPLTGKVIANWNR